MDDTERPTPPGPPIDGSVSSNDSSRGADAIAEWLRRSWPWVLAVVVLVIVAGVLRFWDIGRQSMWFDELFSANTSAYGPSVAIKSTMADTNPPLYYVLQAFFIQWFGRGDGAMRYLPALAGMLATLVMYLAGRKLFDRPTGLWAAALFAVSQIALQYAQEARMYSLLMLFAALELWLFALLLERPTITRAALLGLVLAGMAYTHVYGYMTMLMLLVPVLLMPRIRRRVAPYMVITYPLAILLFLPWALVIPTQVHTVTSQVSSGGWWMKPTADIADTAAKTLGEFSPGQSALPSAIFIALMIAGFAVRPTPAEQREDALGAPEAITETDKVWVIVTLAILPLVTGLVVSAFITPIATTRNALICLPAAYLLAVRGGLKLWRPAGITALVALLLFAVVELPSLYSDTNKGAWHQAVEIVTDKPNTGVLTEDWESAFNAEIYTKVIGRDGAAHVLWVNKLDAQPSPEGRPYDESSETGVPTFVWRWDRVYVMTQNRDSALANYMDKLPGWHLAQTQDLGVPVLRLYTRVQPSQNATQ